MNEVIATPFAAPGAPRTLGAALRIAIEDGRALLGEDDTAYAFDARVWHKARTRWSPCTVCAAGAVMAKRLGVGGDTNREPGYDWAPWERALRAIEALREMDWESAWDEMHGTCHRAFGDPDRPGAMFWEAVQAALWDIDEAQASALSQTRAFDTREGYAAWLDAAENTLAPILERVEETTCRIEQGDPAD